MVIFCIDFACIPDSLGMLILGVALTIGGFFPEALKAKHLISEAVDVQ
jgi:hypothetical protein